MCVGTFCEEIFYTQDLKISNPVKICYTTIHTHKEEVAREVVPDQTQQRREAADVIGAGLQSHRQQAQAHVDHERSAGS